LNTLAQPRREKESKGFLLSLIWSVTAGLLVPALVILVGIVAVLLDTGRLSGDRVHLGSYLWVPLPDQLAAQSPLSQLTVLVVLGLATSALFSLAVWLNRMDADQRARNIVKALHLRLLAQSVRRAELEGAAAQRFRAEQLIGNQLPELQQGLSFWYRAIPRSVLTLVGCVTVALLVNVWLALMALITGIFLWQLARKLRHEDEASLLHWEVPRARSRMADLLGRAPLLARLQTQGLADQAFHAELDSLYRRLHEEDRRLGRIWPILFLAISVAIAVMILGLGVNLFGVESGLSLPAALVLGLALGGAVAAVGRLLRLTSSLRRSTDASDAIYHYLERSNEIAPSEQRVGLVGVRDSVEIQGVSLGDSTGKPILNHLSLKLMPGSMVAILGTDAVSTQALTELLMGFGIPSEGRVTIDGIALRDIHPQALSRNVMWIEPAGPVWEGTIKENLGANDRSIDTRDVAEALQATGVYERLQRLPEGLNTIVSPGDSMLNEETTYGMAVARALLHKPPIVLALEPAPPAEHLPEDPCLKALAKLAEAGALVVILPRRLETLRRADRVVLLNGPRLAGEGKHAELLADSDLYRHLNYLLFNPYRHQKLERSV
jgi:ABC-type multidrug transport system fused ATPase/permease subunit